MEFQPILSVAIPFWCSLVACGAPLPRSADLRTLGRMGRGRLAPAGPAYFLSRQSLSSLGTGGSPSWLRHRFRAVYAQPSLGLSPLGPRTLSGVGRARTVAVGKYPSIGPSPVLSQHEAANASPRVDSLSALGRGAPSRPAWWAPELCPCSRLRTGGFYGYRPIVRTLLPEL